MRTTKLVILSILLLSVAAFLASGRPQAITPSAVHPLQAKGCPRDATHHTLPCTFDSPVTAGDLIVVTGVQGCVYLTATGWDCNTVSDTEGNKFSVALMVNYYNGQPLWYATAVSSDLDTVHFGTSSNAYDLYIIAEYPPSTGLDSANAGYYGPQNSGDCTVGTGGCDQGYSLPLETHESCELLISWSNSGRGGLPEHPADGVAGPSFAIRATEYSLTLEDATTTTPGLYIGTMGFGGYGHWMEGTAAFKMGGCK